MDIVVPAVNAVVVAVAAFLVSWVGKERIDSLERRIDQRFDAIDKRFEQVDRRFEQLDRRFEQVATEIAVIRSDLTNVALAVGARPRPNAG